MHGGVSKGGEGVLQADWGRTFQAQGTAVERP